MACFCSDKKKLDIDYVRKLANAHSVTNKVDVQIFYTFGYDGKTKYYDYEETNRGRKLQIIEVIRFSEPESLNLLSNIEQSGLDVVSDQKEVIKPIKSRAARVSAKPTDSNSGTVLQGD